jgi:hypothetical protein
MLHLHGGSVVERNFLEARMPGVLVTVSLPGLSEKYSRLFQDTNVCWRMLRESGAQLGVPDTPGLPWLRRLTLSSFSAGFGGVRELLKDEAFFTRIHALIMADSIYAGFTGNLAERKVDPARMEGFLRFAREAAAGRKRMIISHCQLRPADYASTAETADYLIAELGGARQAARETWPGDLVLTSRYRRKGLEILGFAGDTGADHLRHLNHLRVFLERLRAAEPAGDS